MTPRAKVGGLADVVAALTKEMARFGHDTRILMPKYGSMQPEPTWESLSAPLDVHISPPEQARLWQCPHDSGATELFLEHDELYGLQEVYLPNRDNTNRFVFLCRAVIDYCHQTGWFPDVIHCHDWMSGLVPVYLNTTEVDGPLHVAASVFTIHNMQHQGEASPGLLTTAGLPQHLMNPDGIAHNGRVNMLKAGIYHATKVTTVSPNYAREVQTPAYGWGLNEALHNREKDTIGILNGVDTDEWNPATDPTLPANFSLDDLSGKAICKQALQERFDLEVDASIPVYAAIARLYSQKGLDLLAEILDGLMHDMKIQIVILGSGDPALEEAFQNAAERYPGRVGCFIGYDSKLSHLIEAGADFFIMPSRFEPCGLNQMYSMAYGTLPIVRETGGLLDSVQQYQPLKEEGTGFRFAEASAAALYHTIGWSCAVWYDQPEEIAKLRQRAMKRDASWAHSARLYQDVYLWAIDTRLRGLGILKDSRTPFTLPAVPSR